MVVKLAEGELIAYLTGRPEATIRWWAHKGWLKRHGKDSHGRTLYSIEEAQQLAATLAHHPELDNPPSPGPT